LIANIFPPIHGGSAVVYHELARGSHGDIVVLAPYRHYQTGHVLVGWLDFDKAAPYRVYRTELLRTQQADPVSQLHSFWLFLVKDIPLRLKILIHISKIMFRERIGVVCIGELDSGSWIGWFAKSLFRCKIINYIHGEEVTTRQSFRFFGRSKAKYLSRCDAAVAVSNFTKQALIERLGVDPHKIELIFNGVALDKFTVQEPSEDLITRYGLDDRLVLLTVGRLIERKGIGRVLQAMPLVISKFSNVHYLIVGQGQYQPELEKLAEELGITEHVTFTGPVDDNQLVAHYALCDIFVMPNRELENGDTEGFGLVFLEANACGKPVIAGRAGGAVDAVKDGYNGLLVEPNNVEDIASAICRLLGDSALHERLRAGGLEWARKSDNRSRAQQFLRLCERLVEHESAG
jgi:phosphatidylinositol alpha-1,6-mannosyltransferase